MESTIRQIPIVIDTKRQESIWVGSLSRIYEQHELQEIRTDNIKYHRFVCKNCNQLVYLHAMRNDESRHGHEYYFSHPKGIECDWKSDTKSRAEIYAAVAEGRKHWEMKVLLDKTLSMLPGWEVIDVDTKFVFNPETLKRAKPDLRATYLGRDVVFEIQLRSESPNVIIGRQEFYKEKGWSLIWLSAESEDQVDEFFGNTRIAVKQVQKDIAFSNRGNWFIFNKGLADTSVENGQLTIMAKVWEPYLENLNIYYCWNQYNITYDQITFDNGEAFYKDFFALDNALKAQLVDNGKQNILVNIDSFKAADWNEFLIKAKSHWPTLDMNVDNDWLYGVYKQDLETRILKVKSTVLTVIRYYSSNQPGADQRWEQLAEKLEHLEFGFGKNMNLRVIQKLLLILGYDLSGKLGRPHKSYAWAVHNFYDYDSFKPYQALCLRAIELSEYKDELLKIPNVVKRLNDPKKKSVENNHELDTFLEWFASSPIYNEKAFSLNRASNKSGS